MKHAQVQPLVIPAQAGIQELVACRERLDARLRGHDGVAP